MYSYFLFVDFLKNVEKKLEKKFRSNFENKFEKKFRKNFDHILINSDES